MHLQLAHIMNVMFEKKKKLSKLNTTFFAQNKIITDPPKFKEEARVLNPATSE